MRKVKKSMAHITQIYMVLAVGTEKVKIGKADGVAYRISTLQTGCPHQLVELFSASVDSPIVERHLHEIFKPLNVGGEWFSLSGDLLDFIEGIPDPVEDYLGEYLRRRGYDA